MDQRKFRIGDSKVLESRETVDGTMIRRRRESSDGHRFTTYERIEITFREEYKIDKGAKVYFEKPESWGDEVYAYIYDVDENENKVWPGKEMTKEDDGKYSYTIERNWNSPLIIFNDGDYTDSVQYPEGKGLKVEADKTYSVKED